MSFRKFTKIRNNNSSFFRDATETLKHGPFFFYIKSSRPFDGCVTFRRTMAGDSHPAKRQRRSVESINGRCHRANAAAARGDLDELKSIAARRELRGTRWDEGTFLEAAKNGRVDCLRFLHEQGCDTGTDASIFAAEAGHVECLKFLLEEKVGGFAPIPEDYRAGANYLSWMLDDYPIHSRTLVAAVEGGHVECLRFLHKSIKGRRCGYTGEYWDDATEALMYEAAARYGRLNVFRYMIVETEHSRRLDGPWVSALEGGGSRWRDIVMECAEYGHLAPDGEHMIHTTAYGLRKRPAAQKYWECVKFLFLVRLNFVVDRGHGNASPINNQLGYNHRDEIMHCSKHKR